ncbi:MAG: DUF4838 domain-containing protein [Lentisphaeria bacterium]|nr:DUF4838 domain-containing protein [Lentisphaeria bacterium]
MKIYIFFSVAFFSVFSLFAGKSITVDPAESAIILPVKADNIKKYAAEELQYHLKLVTGKTVPVKTKAGAEKTRFYIGKAAPSDKKKLLTEEARWQITPEGHIYLYGEDKFVNVNLKNKSKDPKVNFYNSFSRSRTGTLYAVYDFLNNVLKIRHLEPGEKGIAYKKQAVLTLPVTGNSWRSSLEFRIMRPGIMSLYQIRKLDLPKEFLVTNEELAKWQEEVGKWSKRQRLGARSGIHYGHAFTKWWKYYGKKFPQYFAMDKAGVRNPATLGERGQLCMTNAEVIERIYNNWKVRKSDCINLCPNDSTLFCLCPDCRKLGSKSDMMIYQMNAVLEKATRDRKDVRASTYAYLDYIHGPEKIKVHPNAVIGFVSIFLNLRKMEQYYKEWKDMGTKAIFLRPNTFWVDVGLPLGYEKEVYKEFQLGRKYNVIGTDVSSFTNVWASSGIVTYILARSYIEPERSFESLEEEYYSSFGEAAKDSVKKYFRYIRKNIWEKRVMNNVPLEKMYDNLSYYIVPRIKDIITEKDYIEAGKLLAKVDVKKLSPSERSRFEALKLENEHARLTVKAIHAKRNDKMKVNQALLQFRVKHKNDLNILWPNLFRIEKQCDLTGMKAAAEMKEYSYAESLPRMWYFEPDQKDVGVKEKYYSLPLKVLSAMWAKIPITSGWEGASVAQGVPQKLVDILKNYDGIGWYAIGVRVDKSLKGKEIFLRFGAVDETCIVYVNGKKAGEHPYIKPNGWKMPFAINITEFIDWKKSVQTVVVRVEDKQGQGGIWKEVYLTAK